MRMKKIVFFTVMLLTGLNCTAQDVKTLPKPNKQRSTLSVMESFSQRKSMREYGNKPLTDQDLSDLLWTAQGVNRENGNLTAATAMNRQEIRVYLMDAKGVSLYNPKKHSLTKVVDGDHRELLVSGQAFVRTAPIALLMVADMEKFGSSDEHARWMVGVDVGIVSQNIYLFCAAAGFNTVARAMMNQKGLQDLLKLSDKQVPVLNHPVGYPK